MSKRRPCEGDEPNRSGGGCSTREPKRQRQGSSPCSRPATKTPVDDWERGYSIHKLGKDDFDSDAAERPPLVRIAAQHAPSSWSFVAHGTKIMARHAAASSPDNRVGIGARRIVHAAVGGKLLAFVFRYLHVLGPEPPPADKSWSWTTAEPPLPLDSSRVSSYAVHPDGRTVFVSMEKWRDNTSTIRTRNSTFALDTERLEWTHLGEWLLPFMGRAHYDRELDALVGICRFDGDGAGRLCCCDVPPPAAGTMPAWKLGKDVLFDANLEFHARVHGQQQVLFGREPGAR
ncbi:hypothetical protein ACP70R_030706 [Stipagrostis hirtigluma subsp. patula]